MRAQHYHPITNTHGLLYDDPQSRVLFPVLHPPSAHPGGQIFSVPRAWAVPGRPGNTLWRGPGSYHCFFLPSGSRWFKPHPRGGGRQPCRIAFWLLEDGWPTSDPFFFFFSFSFPFFPHLTRSYIERLSWAGGGDGGVATTSLPKAGISEFGGASTMR
jgi:hypothetical protein